MFIIEKGKAYIIKGDRAIKIAFNDKDLKYKETDEEIEYSGQSKYSLNEVIAKLNIRNNIKKAMAKKTAVVNDAELVKQVKDLEDENANLKAELAKKEEEISALNELLNTPVKGAEEDTDAQKDGEKDSDPEVSDPENKEEK